MITYKSIRDECVKRLKEDVFGYRDELAPETEKFMIENNLLLITGASDDLTETYGKIREEFGAGTPIVFDEYEKTFLQSKCECHDCYYFKQIAKNSPTIRTKEGSDCMFEYITDIPHSVYEVYDKDDLYCRAIVIHLDDLFES
jgi:hypothetical protein